jgi:hypothetical protein
MRSMPSATWSTIAWPALRVALGLAQESEQPAGDRAERDPGIQDGEAAGNLTRCDVTQRARSQSCRSIQQIQAAAGEQPRQVRVGPAEPAGDPE